mgnify:CR=1 FL=1
MFHAFTATILRSWNDVLWRKLLHSDKFPVKKFLFFSFLGQFILLFPVMFFLGFGLHKFTLLNLIVLFLVIVLGLLANFFNFKGLQHTKIENAEPLGLSQYIFATLIAFLVFPGERNILSLVLALLGVMVLLSLNVKRHHLKLDRYSLIIIAGSFFYALMQNVMKYLLLFFSPFVLLFYRAFLSMIFVSISLLISFLIINISFFSAFFILL